ncbi:MAG: DNA-formamidopyrimidine glycosylase family protein, partial [Candidatus Binataceae bacterium]
MARKKKCASTRSRSNHLRDSIQSPPHMPELPEVEAVARTLRPLVERRRIRCVHVLHAIATKPQSPASLARMAEGQQIRSVQRKGKYLWLELPHAIITLHFKLDGQLLWFSNAS